MICSSYVFDVVVCILTLYHASIAICAELIMSCLFVHTLILFYVHLFRDLCAYKYLCTRVLKSVVCFDL